MKNSSMRVLHFIMGDYVDNIEPQSELVGKIANEMDLLYQRQQSGSHVTQDIISATEKEALRDILAKDCILGPVLLRMRSIVDQEVNLSLLV